MRGTNNATITTTEFLGPRRGRLLKSQHQASTLTYSRAGEKLAQNGSFVRRNQYIWINQCRRKEPRANRLCLRPLRLRPIRHSSLLVVHCWIAPSWFHNNLIRRTVLNLSKVRNPIQMVFPIYSKWTFSFLLLLLLYIAYIYIYSIYSMYIYIYVIYIYI